MANEEARWHVENDGRLLGAQKGHSSSTCSGPSVVNLMERLTNQLGTCHFVADLANAFYSIAIALESQDQFAFTWEG